MALGGGCLSLSIAFVASSLKLLHKTRSKLSLLYHHTLAFTLGTSLNMRRVVCARASAMGTDGGSCIFYGHLLAFVEVLERNFDLNGHRWPCLLLLLAATIQKTCQKLKLTQSQKSLRKCLQRGYRRPISLAHLRTSLHIGHTFCVCQHLLVCHTPLISLGISTLRYHHQGFYQDDTSNSFF